MAFCINNIPLHIKSDKSCCFKAKTMSKLSIPQGYKPLLNIKQTEIAIKEIKDFFLSNLSTELRLHRVTAPLFVLKGLGINDDLSGTERPVAFPIKDMNEATAEVVLNEEFRLLSDERGNLLMCRSLDCQYQLWC